MINPLQLATDGLAPGHSTYNTATLGYGYKLKVEIFVVDFYTGDDGNVELTPISLFSIINSYVGESNETSLATQDNLSLDSYSGQVEDTNLITSPKVIQRGGSALEIFDSRKEVIVTVRYKNNSYSKHLYIDSITLNKNIKVIATLISIKRRIIDVVVKMTTKLEERIKIFINKIKD